MIGISNQRIRAAGLFFLFIQLMNANPDPALYHRPPAEGTAGEDIELSVTVLTDESVTSGLLYYRSEGALSYHELSMIQRGRTWLGIIPGKYTHSSGLEYAIVLRTWSGKNLASPEDNPFTQPHVIHLKPGPEIERSFSGSNLVAAAKTVAADLLVLSPEPGEILSSETVVIAVSLFNVSNIDTTSIQLTINEKDYTYQTDVTGGIISLIPSDLIPGLHSITIRSQSIYGQTIDPLTWSFSTVKKTLDPTERFEYSGNVASRLSSEYVGDKPLTISETNGRFLGEITWARMKASFRSSNRESQFLQPINRLSTQFELGEYLTIQWGDYYPSLTPFTIDGKRVRGLGVDLHLPFLRFQVVRGELNRAVQQYDRLNGGYLYLSDDTVVDSMGVATYHLDRTGYTFSRSIDAYRLSLQYKSKLRLGVNFLKSKDNPESITRVFSPGTSRFTVDSTDVNIPAGTYTYNQFASAVQTQGGNLVLAEDKWGGGDPADNLVFGFDFGASADRRKMEFDFSWYLSLYNRNIWDGAMTRAQMDTTLDDSLDGFIGVQYDADGLITSSALQIDTTQIFDPTAYADLFTINVFMTPLVPFDFASFEDHPISTVVNMPSSAFHLRLKGNYYGNNFSVEYRQIGPEFVSLGNPYLTSNIREFILTDRLSLIENKLALRGSYKHRDNKILRTTIDPLNTNTMALNMTLVPGPGSPSLMFNFQSIGKDNEKTELDTAGTRLVDLRENSRSNNSLISLNYPLSTGSLEHSLVINYSSVSNVDNLATERRRDFLFQKTDTKTVSFTLSSRYQSPLRTIFSMNQTELLVPIMKDNGTAGNNTYIWTAYGINGQYAFFDNKLRVMSELSYLKNSGLVVTNIYGMKMGGNAVILDNLNITVSTALRLNHTPEFDRDVVDNDKDGKIDESGEAWDMNTFGVNLNMEYRF